MRAAHMNKAGMSARGSWVWCCELIYGWQTLFHTRGVGEEESARPLVRGKITLIGRPERASQSPPVDSM